MTDASKNPADIKVNPAARDTKTPITKNGDSLPIYSDTSFAKTRTVLYTQDF